MNRSTEEDFSQKIIVNRSQIFDDRITRKKPFRTAFSTPDGIQTQVGLFIRKKNLRTHFSGGQARPYGCESRNRDW